MTVFDYVVLVVVGLSILLSVMRGLLLEVLALAAWALSFWLASRYAAAGANWMTIICAAPLATVEKGHAVAQACGGEIQIELFGNWTLDDARDWHRIGVRQAIYHRGRDAQASGQQWGEADLARMKALSDIGLELSITGGITPADLPLFKDIRVKAFIAGRALAGAANPAQVAGDFHAQIDAIWGGKRA